MYQVYEGRRYPQKWMNFWKKSEGPFTSSPLFRNFWLLTFHKYLLIYVYLQKKMEGTSFPLSNTWRHIHSNILGLIQSKCTSYQKIHVCTVGEWHGHIKVTVQAWLGCAFYTRCFFHVWSDYTRLLSLTPLHLRY